MRATRRLKDLIRKHSESNNIPKFDKRKYTGKLLKDDYLASLIDVLREINDGDYRIVSELIEKESRQQEKRGFGKS